MILKIMCYVFADSIFLLILIFLTVTSLNLVGEGFRNAIDPKLKGA